MSSKSVRPPYKSATPRFSSKSETKAEKKGTSLAVTTDRGLNYGNATFTTALTTSVYNNQNDTVSTNKNGVVLSKKISKPISPKPRPIRVSLLHCHNQREKKRTRRSPLPRKLLRRLPLALYGRRSRSKLDLRFVFVSVISNQLIRSNLFVVRSTDSRVDF